MYKTIWHQSWDNQDNEMKGSENRCCSTSVVQQGSLGPSFLLYKPWSRSRGSSVLPPAATFREEMAARGGFQTAPTGGGGGAMGPGPPVPGAGPGMGPGTPSGRMGPSSAAQNHMYRSPMPGPGYPVRYRSILASDALACPLEQSLLPLLCHRWLTVTTAAGAGRSSDWPTARL